MNHKEITWNNLQIPVVGSFDVVIIGGGVSGSACGIRCVNEGLSTLIVDKSNLLGGSATRALVCPHDAVICASSASSFCHRAAALGFR